MQRSIAEKGNKTVDEDGERDRRAWEEEWKAGESERRGREKILLQQVAVISLFGIFLSSLKRP